MPSQRQRLISMVIGIIATLLFGVISIYTIIWANGLKFDVSTGSFEKTAVIAVKNDLNNLIVSLNGNVVGNRTPITLDNLTKGDYRLTLAKEGFRPYEQFFRLSAGEAGVIKKAVLIAQQPLTKDQPTAHHQANEPFDVGLSVENGELLDYDRLISRFSGAVSQAHRFNGGNYLYQQGAELHLLLTANNQDFVIYTSASSDRLKINLSPSDWSVTIFDGPVPQQLFLTQPA